MATLDTIRKPVEEDLKRFDRFVRTNFGRTEEGMLTDMLDYILSSRGKGLRPAVVMLAAGAVAPERGIGTRTMVAAMLVEMIHVASLIHDDVIDESDFRRSRPSVNARWQSRNAVIAGDYILARNMELGISSGQIDLLRHIIGGIATLCEGEILQSDHARRLDVARADYLDIIRRKTASLFAISASAGAMSAGADRRTIERMSAYGEWLGVAFQIADDILDYTGGPTGKPAGNDLRERKITLPLIEVMERCGEQRRREIVELVARCAEQEQCVGQLTAMVVEGGGIEAARCTMESFVQRAMSELAGLEASPFRDSLVALCAYVAERDR